MHAAAGAGNIPEHGIAPLAFRNQCGRRGCGHIFEYDGPNPLGNIERLVKEHSPLCRLSEGSTSRTSSPSMGSLQGLPLASGSFTGKKTARSEAERRLALETDEWTLRVTPHEVVCRGCRRTIKLDRRSRYYPGLWETRGTATAVSM
ncbi:hypothetical protein B0H13DRAFT_1867676 [Mycena leptocephala]|nr:hypothetical protein B0H13DRAFT_1867676 [Mycena leptocephala]